MKKLIFGLALVAAMSCSATDSVTKTTTNPKEEFRGAWIHTVSQGQYAKMSTDECKAYLTKQLDLLRAAGCNAVVFQVRPSADAFYASELEPWSRFLTGTAGKAPVPAWDPLQFMIEESHARGMELHAWLNPYRVTTSKTEVLAKNHIYYKHPERFVTYDGKRYFDPGLPENRDFIESVVRDIVTRYDVDAIHMDDYFYPYPVKGVDFPDSESFKKYGNGMTLGDWRRHNVDLLIEGLHRVITETKPWVRFGISPFGIWRNKASDSRGSDTNGLQNYDDLYADVILWTKNGWVDYMVPQLYWELEKKVASSEKLAYWWNDNANGRHMYIGQDVNKTMDTPDLTPSTNPTQLDHKIRLSRELPNIHGNCWWPGYSITKNYKGVADSLASKQQSTIALVPASTWLDDVKPAEVENLRFDNGRLTWTHSSTDVWQQAKAFVVYCVPEGDIVCLDNAATILCVTNKKEYVVPAEMKGKYIFIVTAIDRANNESIEGARISVKL